MTDAAHILTVAQQTALTTKLTALERATQHQVVVATVPSLGGRDVDAFTKDLFNAWGVGRREYNDGVVFLVAPNERKVRITVGYGLENVLTDNISSNILKDKVLPRFKSGDFYRGSDAAVDEISARLKIKAGLMPTDQRKAHCES